MYKFRAFGQLSRGKMRYYEVRRTFYQMIKNWVSEGFFNNLFSLSQESSEKGKLNDWELNTVQ